MDFLNSYAFEQMAREYHAKYNVAQTLNKKDDEIWLKVKTNFEEICRLFCMLKNSFVETFEKNINTTKNTNKNENLIIDKQLDKKINKDEFQNLAKNKQRICSTENNRFRFRGLFSNFRWVNRYSNYNCIEELGGVNKKDNYKNRLIEVFESFDTWIEKAKSLFDGKFNCDIVIEKTSHKDCAIIFIDLLNDYIYIIDSVCTNKDYVQSGERYIFFEKAKQLYIEFFKNIKNFYKSL